MKKDKTTVYNLDALPAWEPAEDHRSEMDVPPGKVWWSGHRAGAGVPEPPAIGDRVFVNINGFGAGTVRGYFIEFGWLGVYVEVDNPPDWYRKQIAAYPEVRPANPRRLPMIFGAELTLNVGKGVA